MATNWRAQERARRAQLKIARAKTAGRGDRHIALAGEKKAPRGELRTFCGGVTYNSKVLQARRGVVVDCIDCMDAWIAWQAQFPPVESTIMVDGVQRPITVATRRKPTFGRWRKWMNDRAAEIARIGREVLNRIENTGRNDDEQRGPTDEPDQR